MLAARDQMRTTFSLDENSCEVGFDGTPKPSAGEFYVAVHGISWGVMVEDWDLSEEYQFAITLTMRMAAVPKDRRGVAVWLLSPNGMEARIRAAVIALHHNQAVRIAANTYLVAREAKLGIGGEIVGVQRLARIEMPVLRDYSWFGAEPPESDIQAERDCGVSQTIVFGKVQRVQAIPTMD
jgi:hypothetical protein